MSLAHANEGRGAGASVGDGEQRVGDPGKERRVGDTVVSHMRESIDLALGSKRGGERRGKAVLSSSLFLWDLGVV